jgi:hypothetical protein
MFTRRRKDMKWIVKLDEFYLGIMERFCHWFQRMTGKTNFFLAKIAAAIFCITVIIQLIERVGSGQRFEVSWLLDYWSIIASLGTIIWYYDSEEYKAVRRLVDGMKNPIKIDPLYQILRVLAVTALLITYTLEFTITTIYQLTGRSVPGEPHLLVHIQGVTMMLWLYFIACDSLPPGSGRIQDYLMRLFGKTSLATSQE